MVKIRKSRGSDEPPLWFFKFRFDWAAQLLEGGYDRDMVQHILEQTSEEVARAIVKVERAKLPDAPDIDYLNGGGWDEEMGESTNG